MIEPVYTSLELYRRIHLGNEPDVDIYLRAASGAKQVLDLGCGWGRITVPLAERGYHVTAVDQQAEFLSELVSELNKRSLAGQVQVVEQDITQLKLAEGQLFDRVFIPYNTLYALGGRANILRCLTLLRDYTRPSSELWFDIYEMDEFHENFDADEEAEEDGEPVASWSTGDSLVSVVEETEVDHDEQRLLVTYRAIDSASGCQVGELKMTHSYLLTAQLDDLLAQAGFELRASYPASLLSEGAQQGEEPDAAESLEASGPIYHVAIRRPRSPRKI